MWKINSKKYSDSCCCGRSDCAEPRAGSPKMTLAPFLCLNRKLCEHSLRNKAGSSEIWTLLNPRDAGTESAVLVFSCSEEKTWNRLFVILNIRIWPAIQPLAYAQQKQKECNKNRKGVGYNSRSVIRNKENSSLTCCLYGNCVIVQSLYVFAHCFLHCTGNTFSYMNSSIHWFCWLITTQKTRKCAKKMNYLILDVSFGVRQPPKAPF